MGCISWERKHFHRLTCGWHMQVLPQGSVKAKPSAAIGAALGPHLVLPNGNVSGPRACAPVEAFELPGSIAKGAAVPPAPPNAAAATAFDYHPGLASAPFPSPGAATGVRPAGPAAGSPGRAAPLKPPVVPKPKAKPRPLFDGEERKRGPAGRTSMYKVYFCVFVCMPSGECCIGALSPSIDHASCW